MNAKANPVIIRKSYLFPLGLALMFLGPQLLDVSRDLDASSFLPAHFLLVVLNCALALGILTSPLLIILGWRRDRRSRQEALNGTVKHALPTLFEQNPRALQHEHDK